MRPALAAIIFDADGTLLDSLLPHIAFCRALAAQHPELGVCVPRADQLNACRALAAAPMHRFLRNAGFPVDRLEAFVAEYEASFADRFPTPPFEGVDRMLATLGERRGAGLRLVVVSSNTSANVRRGFAHCVGADLLAHFDFVWGIDNAHREKRQSIADALRSLGVAADRAVYVGDTRKDCASAVANGVQFVGVDYGFEDLAAAKAEGALPGCDAVVASPAELLRALLAWWESEASLC
jgi:phosphoglycolate phosphatase-like HAD superfamily hydrolase